MEQQEAAIGKAGADGDPAAGGKKRSGVLRNTLMLVGGQLAGVPLSILLSVTIGRFLGATDFGYLYLASTMAQFGFLLVEWGHGNVIASAVAQDNSRAGSLLGTSLLWRTITTVIVTVGLLALSVILGYAPAFHVVLLLIIGHSFVGTVRVACQDLCRGFERLDIGAYAQLGSQVLAVVVVIPTLFLGGRLTTLLVVQGIAGLIVAFGVWTAARSIARFPISVDKASMRNLFTTGSSFLLFGVVMALQPNVDAIFLTKLTSPEVLGWQAAANRLTGFITMPAVALVSALFPTLSRLHVEDPDGFRTTATRALEGTSLLAIPAALSCALYRDVGAQIFGEGGFKPVEQNLLALSPLIFLLYFSMPIGVSILAAGRQRPFAIVQILCIVVSAGLDPLLIPWFQKHYSNGGLGVCVAGSVSEVAVLAAASPLIPKGIVTWALGRSIGKGLLAGVAMAVVAFALRRITPYVAAPLALISYVAALWLVGGIRPEHVQVVRETILKRISRTRA